MTAERIALQLLQIKAIKLSPQKPFIWTSGLRSPIYCDNRLILSYPEFRNYLIDAFIQSAKAYVPFDMVAGVATAGIAHGALIADRMELPFIYVRSEPKSHGMGNQIEGKLDKDQRVLVIEDLLSTGGSCIKAVEAIRESDCQVAGVLAIFSYGFQSCVQAFLNAKVKVQTLTNFPTVIQIAESHHFITEVDCRMLETWNSDPVFILLQSPGVNKIKTTMKQIWDQTIQLPVIVCSKNPIITWKTILKSLKLIYAAGGIVQNPKSQYLFIHRRGWWDLPKGKIESGESKRKAALREVNEEVGLDCTITSSLRATHHVYMHKNKLVLKKTYWYLMYSHSFKPTLQKEEDIIGYTWKSARQLASMKSRVYPNLSLLLEELE